MRFNFLLDIMFTWHKICIAKRQAANLARVSIWKSDALVGFWGSRQSEAAMSVWSVGGFVPEVYSKATVGTYTIQRQHKM